MQASASEQDLSSVQVDSDAVLEGVTRKFHEVARGLLSRHLADYTDDNGAGIQDVREKLDQEYQRLHVHLESLSVPELTIIDSCCGETVTALNRGELEAASVALDRAGVVAKGVVLSSRSFAIKAIATRIRVLSALFLNEYFGSANPEVITAECSLALSDLTCSAEVKDALKAAYGKKRWSIFHIASSHIAAVNILQEVANIRSRLIEYTGASLDIRNKHGEPILLCSATCEELKGHREAVHSLTLYGERLYSGCRNGTIKIWDPFSKMELGSLVGHTDTVYSMVFLKGFLFSASRDRTIRIWDDMTKAELACLRGHSDYIYTLVTDGIKVYSGSRDQSIRVWDESCIASLTSVAVYRGHAAVQRTLLIDDGKLYLGGVDYSIRVWRLSSMIELACLTGHTDDVYALLANGDALYSGSYDTSIRIWDRACLIPLRRLNGHTGAVNSLTAFNGRLFSGSADQTIRVWDLKAESEIAQLKTPKDVAVNIVVSGGGLLIAGSTDPTIRVWLS